MNRFDLASGTSGAAQAKGTVAVVDVAFSATTAACAFSQGVKRIFPCFSIVAARRLTSVLREPVVVAERPYFGEVGGYENSPSEILAADNLSGRDMVLITSAGCACLSFCNKRMSHLLVSFPTLSASAKYLRSVKENVTIVGASSDDMCDMFCCEQLLHSIVSDSTMASGSCDVFARRILGSCVREKRRDYSISLTVDMFDFVLEASCTSQGICITRC